VSGQTYISLDLETTGLDAESDEIVEIAAVKFQDGDIISTFHSLVNPHRPLPYHIQLLCGITQAEVDAAPPFSALTSELASFLAAHPIIGHNVWFDLGFLAQKGIQVSGPNYDTLELGKILLPQLFEHALGSVARFLGIPCPIQHRALADAITAKEVFLALLDKASQLDLPAIGEIAHLTTKAGPGLGHLFQEIEKSKSQAAFSFTEPQAAEIKSAITSKQPLYPCPEKTPLDIEKLSAIFDDGGPLSRAFPDYERRPEQLHMMQAVAQALNNSQHLIVEAGTGTGKSIAYLLPSIFFALENKAHVVISTNTINLQEQLMGKDIPDLAQALGSEHSLDELQVVQVKGRNNYLCLRRWNSLRRGEGLSPAGLKLLARIRSWLTSTQSGDRAGLNLSGEDIPTWNKVCAQVNDCWAGNCPYQRRDACFLFRARKAAEGAHIIVVNHALLLSDMVAGAKILPEYHYLIIDEAHHLEQEATKQLGSEITQRELLDYLSRLDRKVEGQHRMGFLSKLRELLTLSTVIPLRRTHLEQLSGDLRSRVNKARAQGSQFFDILGRFIWEYADEQGEYDRHLRLTQNTRGKRAWSEVESAWDDLNLALKDIADALNGLYIGLADLFEGRLPDYENFMLELSSLLYANEELQRRINSLVSHPEANDIYWLSLSGENNLLSLCTAPLTVAGILEKQLFSAKECVVLTGATLSTEGNFEYIKQRLGLDEANELALGSPFDYLSSTLVYIPGDIPEPGEPGYQPGVEKAISELCGSSRGRSLVLFTSHAALKTTLAAIRAPLAAQGILVLGHGVDGSPKQLLETFKIKPKAVLLGTSSFWEGVDVVGEALSVLIMARLPFNVPTDPIFSARSELFSNPFNQYALPQAALRFKQGFGRLIRSKNDRGIMVVLDSRLKHKSYGAAFFNSLPPCTVVTGSLQDLPRVAAGWLEGGSHEASP
jgi:DNA polymerase-3 subunit epsilon/ATP-dependent DNA helicase DinG